MPDKLEQHHQQESKLLQLFRATLLICMRAPKTTICITIMLFMLSIAGMKFVPQQFFPSSDRPELLVNMQLPQNSSIFATSSKVTKLEQLLEKNSDIVRWISYIGRGAIRFYLPLEGAQANPSFAQTVIVTKDIEARERVRTYLQKEFKREFFNYKTAESCPLKWGLQLDGHYSIG